MGLQLGGLWFISALFIISIVYFLCDEIILSSCLSLPRSIPRHIPILIFAFLVCGYGLYFTLTEATVKHICVGLFFFAVGVSVRHDCIFDKLTSLIEFRGLTLGVTLLLGIGVWFLSQANSSVLMVDNLYGDRFLFLSCSLLGICMAIGGGISIGESSVLKYFGQRTLIILFIHFPIMRFLNHLLNHCSILDMHATTKSLITFVITMACMIPIARLFEKFLPVLAGKY